MKSNFFRKTSLNKKLTFPRKVKSKSINEKLILFLMIVFLISSASAVCTITLNKESYAPTETVTAEISCSVATEKSKAYSINWSFNGVKTYEWDTGTTPSTTGETFYETFILNSTYAGAINVSMNGTNLEGYDVANVTGASANSLLISNITVGGKWLGLTTSVKAIVRDSNGKKISGGTCRYSSWSNDETTMLSSGIAPMFNGQVKFDWILDYSGFEEATDYRVLLSCYCGGNSSTDACIDEDGTVLEYYLGDSSSPFTTNSWISVLQAPLPITYENGTAYPTDTTSLFAGFDNVYFRRNVTNNYGAILQAYKDFHIVNNATGQLYPIEQSSHSNINTGNSSTIFEYIIPEDLETGVYYIRAFADVYYSGIHVVTKIMTTDTFNTTSIQDTMTINTITIKDYWGNEVNTSASLLSDDSMPTSNYTDPYTVLTEGFGYQICGNITNAYSSNIYWHMENLIIHNPTTGWSFEEFHRGNGVKWQRVLKSGDSDICWYSNIPLTIPTHSDYHFDFDVYIGDEEKPFCGDDCAFSGETQYVYIGAIEDSIVFDKWYTKPSAGADGVPLTFIVTEREEYLTMNDDCNYTNQIDTDWGNATFKCIPKDGGAQIHQNLSVYPRAGEEFKVCFQTQNYLADEVDLEFYDFYIDSDAGETVIFWPDESDGYIPSIQDDKLWVSETPSRSGELGGNLIDGYGIMCSKWMTLPNDVQGGNNWDIQGKVRINPEIYNLEEGIVWNWESDEFPIFGTRQDEDFMRLVDITNITTSSFGGSVTACNSINVTITYDYDSYEENTFIAEYCFENTDDDYIAGCFERLVNPDFGDDNQIIETFQLPYFDSGGNGEVYVHIHGDDESNLREILLGYGDVEPANTFTIVANTSDSCKYSQTYEQELELRQSEALEGIETKTGTFHMDINCPDYGEIGGNIECVITAQIEESQTVEKEVDFTCYMVDNGEVYSSVNFNQMITKTPVNIVQSFAIPFSFRDQSQYVVQCYGDYYNLGKRRDSFYDTFTIRGWASGSGGGSQRGLPSIPSITGGVVDGDGGIPTIISKNYLYLIVFVIVVFLIILFMKKKSKKERAIPCNTKGKGFFKKFLFVILILLIITGVLFGLFYGFKAIANSFDNDSQTQEIVSIEQIETPLPQSYSMIKDKLFRGIILTGFIVLMIIILFKALNLRGEVKFGHDGNYYEDKRHTKMQNKLNRMLVKDDIKRQKNKKNYNVKKMSAEDFSKRLYKSEREKNNI